MVQVVTSKKKCIFTLIIGLQKSIEIFFNNSIRRSHMKKFLMCLSLVSAFLLSASVQAAAPMDGQGMEQGRTYQGSPINGGVVDDPAPAMPQAWERDMGNGYCQCCCYKPCYSYTCDCEMCPKYVQRKCCRMVPKYYQVKRCRMVPQEYCETCCQMCPDYYCVTDCCQCPKYTYHRHCSYEPQYTYKCCPKPCPQPCCPEPQQACCPPSCP